MHCHVTELVAREWFSARERHWFNVYALHLHSVQGMGQANLGLLLLAPFLVGTTQGVSDCTGDSPQIAWVFPSLVASNVKLVLQTIDSTF